MKNAIHRVTKHNYIIDTCLVSCFKVLEESLKQVCPGPRPSSSFMVPVRFVLCRPRTPLSSVEWLTSQNYCLLLIYHCNSIISHDPCVIYPVSNVILTFGRFLWKSIRRKDHPSTTKNWLKLNAINFCFYRGCSIMTENFFW